MRQRTLAILLWLGVWTTPLLAESGGSVSPTPQLENSCASIKSCSNCSNTYTCHWCEFDQQCHSRGSVHGCAWGVSCDKVKPHENSTCASQTTCSECGLSSHFCHWCEHDNACHARGSPYGCTTGVDCYSNDRCRRKKPEPVQENFLRQVPTLALVLILVIGSILLLYLSMASCFFTKDTTETAPSNSVPTAIGGSLSALEDQFPQTPSTDDEVQDTNNQTTDEETPQGGDENVGTETDTLLEAQQPEQVATQDPDANSDPAAEATTPLLSPPATPPQEDLPESEQTPRKKPFWMRSLLYYLSMLFVCVFAFFTLFYYPKMPIYNVCNDAVAWKGIIQNIASGKLDASFEILVSVENPNHISAQLEGARGNFTFEGQPLGSYEIPPVMVDGASITDLMLISRVKPDKYQAVRLAEAYYHGKLTVVADFHATLRAPALMNLKYKVNMKDITVYVNELGDRSLCHCPSWDDGNNHSLMSPLPFL